MRIRQTRDPRRLTLNMRPCHALDPSDEEASVEVTAAQLVAIMPHAAAKASLYIEPLNAALVRWDIGTPTRAAMFLAQVAHETAELHYMREIASGAAYEGRLDLGNTQPGDGERFPGRGGLQATGRDMYRRISLAIYGDLRLLDHPELLETPDGAMQSAGFIWAVAKGLNRIADAGTQGGFLLVSKRINGVNRSTGYPNGWESRLGYWLKAKPALGVAA